MQQKMYRRLLLVAFVYNTSANFVHPVTPTLIQQAGLADHMFGVLFAVMSVGYLLSSAFAGRVCDRIGRWIVLVVGLVGYALSQLLFGLTTNMYIMLLGRFLAGVFASGATVAMMAMIVDMTSVRERAAHLSVYAALISVASSMGYFIGGMLGASDYRRAFYAQAIGIGLCVLMSVVLLRGADGLRPDGVRDPLAKRRLTRREMAEMLGAPILLFLLGVAFANFATYGFDNSFNYYLKGELGFDASVNGIVKAATGLIGLMANLFVNRWILKHFEQNKALSCILCLCAATLFMVARMTTVAMFFAVSVVFYLFNALYQPIQQSLSAREQMANIGLLSGLFYSARAVGMIFGPLAAGYLYEVGALWPFYLACAAFAVAGALTYMSYLASKRKLA